MTKPAPHDAHTPVLRRFLSGGPERLRLSVAAMMVLAAYAVAASVLRELAAPGLAGGWPIDWPGAIGAACAAVATGVLAARWLGSPLGFAAGMIQATILQTLAPLGTVGALAAVAMLAFAWANVPGRLAPAMSGSLSILFYLVVGEMLALGGWGDVAGILLACVAYVLLNQDGRAFRFLAHPVGLGVFAGFAIWRGYSAALVVNGAWPMSGIVVAAMLPLALLCAIAVVAGCWRGHYATAFWQFVACWSLASILLAGAGVLSGRSALAAISPPLAIFAAAGLQEIVRWWRTKTHKLTCGCSSYTTQR